MGASKQVFDNSTDASPYAHGVRRDGTRSPYPVIEVVGYDGKGGKVCTDRPTRDDLWKVEGTVKGNSAFIDFSPKGGPDKLLAKYEDGGIVFPDGNKWTKVARGTPNRRPEDPRNFWRSMKMAGL